MSTTSGCPLSQQAVGWALHALEPDEEMAVLLHLPHCIECQTAVQEAEQVLSALGATVVLREPPASLRDSLMAKVAQTPQRPPVLRPRPDTDDAVAPTASRRPSSTRTHRLDAQHAARPARGGRSWLTRRGRALVAASLAVVAAVTLGGLVIRTSQLEQQRDAESAQAQGLTEFLSQIDEPGARHAVLTSTTDGTTVAAVVEHNGVRQVYPIGLPANPSDHVYVMWGVAPGADPRPLSSFDIGQGPPDLRAVESAAAAGEFPQYAISIEPGRVAPASPTVIVASGQVEI